jgi:hypothetical protein
MRALAIAVSLAATGCGATIAELVQHRHYREAICAGDEGNATDRREVTDALWRDAALHLHVHDVTSSELEPVLAEHTERVMRRARFLRVRLQTNVLPVDGWDLRLELTDTVGVAHAAPLGYPSLAFATDETLPPSRLVETYGTGDNVLKGIAAVLTLGMSLPFTEFRPGLVETGPTPMDYAKSAPLATSLRDALGTETCDRPGWATSRAASHRCEAFFVLENRPRARWQLHIEQTFAASRVGVESPDDDEAVCRIARRSRIDLGSNVEAFGPRMLPVELHDGGAQLGPNHFSQPPATSIKRSVSSR